MPIFISASVQELGAELAESLGWNYPLLNRLFLAIQKKLKCLWKIEQFWLWQKKVCHQKLETILGTKIHNINDFDGFVNLR